MLAFSICAVLLIVILAPAALADNSSSINILLLGTDNFGYQYSGIGENEEMSRADAIYLFRMRILYTRTMQQAYSMTQS